MISHTKEYGVYHWDTFDNKTILIHEEDNIIKCRKFVLDHYKGRISPEGADKVEIVDSIGAVRNSYHVK